MKSDAYQLIVRKAGERRIPLVAHWELTYRCNLDCVHCYATSRERPGEMNAAEVAAGLEQLAGLGCLFLNLTGGEALMRRDILDIIRIAKGLNFAVRLLTNGVLLEPAMADRLAELGLISVEISLYALDPAVHDAITRRPGSHSMTMAGIRAALDRGLNVAIKTMIMRSNVREFEGLAEFARSAGARFVFDYILVPADNGARPMDEHGLNEDELTAFILARGRPGVPSADTPPDSEPLCGAGATGLAVTPDGDVLPCLAIRRNIGNIRTRPLAEIWRDPALDKIRDFRYSDLEKCGKCDLLKYCLRCPGVALAEGGGLLGCSGLACMAARAARRAAEDGGKAQ